MEAFKGLKAKAKDLDFSIKGQGQELTLPAKCAVKCQNHTWIQIVNRLSMECE